MLRTRIVVVLLLGATATVGQNRVGAQQPLDDAQQRALLEDIERQTPDFLQPPPIDVIRSGLQPLETQLPDTRVLDDGLMPPDVSRRLFDERWTSPSYDRGDQWTPMGVHWAPSGNRYRPTYFEDTMLERHGQSRHPVVQPLASGARFFTTIAALPYAAVVNPPCRPVSPLGHFRVGSATPCLLQRPPLQVDAGLFQAGLVVGLIFIVP